MKRPRLRFALAAVAGLVICYAGEGGRGTLHFRAALAAPQAAEAWQKTRSADDCHNSGGRRAAAVAEGASEGWTHHLANLLLRPL